MNKYSLNRLLFSLAFMFVYMGVFAQTQIIKPDLRVENYIPKIVYTEDNYVVRIWSDSIVTAGDYFEALIVTEIPEERIIGSGWAAGKYKNDSVTIKFRGSGGDYDENGIRSRDIDYEILYLDKNGSERDYHISIPYKVQYPVFSVKEEHKVLAGEKNLFHFETNVTYKTIPLFKSEQAELVVNMEQNSFFITPRIGVKEVFVDVLYYGVKIETLKFQIKEK